MSRCEYVAEHADMNPEFASWFMVERCDEQATHDVTWDEYDPEGMEANHETMCERHALLVTTQGPRPYIDNVRAVRLPVVRPDDAELIAWRYDLPVSAVHMMFTAGGTW
jgi:hypothetical protein